MDKEVSILKLLLLLHDNPSKYIQQIQDLLNKNIYLLTMILYEMQYLFCGKYLKIGQLFQNIV